MAERFEPFDLHTWHKTHDPQARIVIGGSGLPPADLAPYVPASPEAWQETWSAGLGPAIDAVKGQLASTYGFAPDEVLLTQGASEADFLATYGLVGPGDHVVVEAPAYFALVAPPRSLGANATRVERRVQDGFALDASPVENAITERTRLVLFARPNNPTGQVVPDDDLVRIAEAAERVGAYVLVDEVFAEATELGDTPAMRLHDHILSVNSVTKCMGFGALHVGWIAGPAEVIERLERVKDHVRPLAPLTSLVIAERVLNDRRRILAATRARRRENFATLARFMNDQDVLAWVPPEHGTTAVLQLPEAHRDDLAFAKRLLANKDVLVAPGSYLEMPGWIRIGLLSKPETFGDGLRAVARAVG